MDKRHWPRPARRRRRAIYLVGGVSPQRARIAATVRALPDELRYAATLDDVTADLARETVGTVVLVDDGSDVCSPTALRAFRMQDAATVILLATRAESRTAHQVAALARAGLDGLY
ncbi:MAG: hypothetical protein ACREOG_13740, partial [Gemmatimonadaceae bacterium]